MMRSRNVRGSSPTRIALVVLVTIVVGIQFLVHSAAPKPVIAQKKATSKLPLPPRVESLLKPKTGHQQDSADTSVVESSGHESSNTEEEADAPERYHPKFPKGAPIPRPYRLDPAQFTARQKRVVKGIAHAFNNYAKYAWGHDELLPNSKSYSDWGDDPRNSGIGLTAIEVLDTLWLTAQYDLFNKVIKYLKTEHSFDKNVDCSLFETTIRVLGGLLSCYELSGEEICLTKADDLGERLFSAFDGTIPYSTVNLMTRRAMNPPWLGDQQSLSEVTTIQLEFKKLSQFTGKMKYDKAAMNVMKAVFKQMHKLNGGLFSIFVKRHDGSPSEGKVTLGARGDSFYEYIAKQWVLTNKTEDWLLEAYELVSNGVADHLLVQTSPDEALIAEATSTRTLEKELKMDHLVCFAVGMFQLGKHGRTAERDDKIAQDVARTCNKMYTMNPTGIGPEIVRFRGPNYEMYPSPGAHHYILRPEAMEGMFYNARFHPENYDYWADMGWKMYENIEKYCKVPNGWQGLHDVTVARPSHTEKQESFFLAETLKYAFLIGADKDLAMKQLPLDQWVLNTECHPLRVMSGPLKYSQK